MHIHMVDGADKLRSKADKANREIHGCRNEANKERKNDCICRAEGAPVVSRTLRVAICGDVR